MDANEKWLAPKEVAGMYGWSVDTVRRLVARGLLRAIVLPQASSRRKRMYRSMRIAQSSLILMEKKLEAGR